MKLVLNDNAPIVGDNETERRLQMSARLSGAAELQTSPVFLNAAHKALYMLSNARRLDELPDASSGNYYFDGGHLKQESFLNPASVDVPAGMELAVYNYNGALYDYVIRAEYYGNGTPLDALSGKCQENAAKMPWLYAKTWQEILVAIGATQFAKPWLRNKLGMTAAAANAVDVYSKSNPYRQYSDDYDSAAVTVTPRRKIFDRTRYFRTEINDVVRGFEFLKPIAGQIRELNEAFYAYVLAKENVTPLYLYASQIAVLQPIGTEWDETLTLVFGRTEDEVGDVTNEGVEMTAPMFCRLAIDTQ